MDATDKRPPARNMQFEQAARELVDSHGVQALVVYLGPRGVVGIMRCAGRPSISRVLEGTDAMVQRAMRNLDGLAEEDTDDGPVIDLVDLVKQRKAAL